MLLLLLLLLLLLPDILKRRQRQPVALQPLYQLFPAISITLCPCDWQSKCEHGYEIEVCNSEMQCST
jgi:hypothetical protein